MVEGFRNDITDATKYGPPSVPPINAINNEFGLIQHTPPLPDNPTHSDLEELNLNIPLPLDDENGKIDSSARLLVYVFLHGGGLAVGSNWYPQYGAASLTKTSIEKRKPMIGITINYRLGVTGFMISKELRSQGYKANNGFHDRRTAMRWI
ncbi:hypothetical protein ACN47E_009134 [Coniothyrium glycines]